MASDEKKIKEYTVREAAEVAKTAEVTIRRHMAKGALFYVKRKGGAVRIPHTALVEYLGYDSEGEK